MLFIAHVLPRGLPVDEVIQFGPRSAAKDGMPSISDPSPPKQMAVIEEEKVRS